VPRFLVTGAMGCLGAWTLRTLLDEGADVVAFDYSSDDHRLRLLLSDAELDEVRFVRGDVADTGTVRGVVGEERVTHIIHLAALQVPFCKADPPRGAAVNVVGTVNILEAARSVPGVEGVAYASSMAVFGAGHLYPDPVGDEGRRSPETLYGVYKQAGEDAARIYFLDHGLISVGLRPYIVYGPGRDQGLTSEATKAMLAAAAGQPFHIGHGGTAVYQYAADVARLFVAAARSRPARAEVLNVGGPSTAMGDVVAAIEAAVPELSGALSFEEGTLPFPSRLDDAGLQRLLGGVAYTPLHDGVAASIDRFKRLLAAGMIAPPTDTS
jgi:UDP-glucuronate 4-epimerase